MKKIKLILLFLSVVVIAACSSDDDNTESGQIEGVWKADLFYMEGEVDEGEFTVEGIDFSGMKVDFKPDGTYVSDGDSFTVKYTMNMMGQEFSDTATNENPFNEGTWEKNGNTLTVKDIDEDEDFDFKIEKLTSNRLEISSRDIDVEEMDELVEGNFKVTIGFKR